MGSTGASNTCPKCGGMLVPTELPPDGEAARGPVVCAHCGAVNPGSAPTAPNRPALLLIGPIVAAAGALVVYIFGYRPYVDALNQAPSISLSLSGMVLGPVFVILGLALTALVVLPRNRKAQGASPEKLGFLGKLICALVIAAALAGFVGFFWVRNFVKSQGYNV